MALVAPSWMMPFLAEGCAGGLKIGPSFRFRSFFLRQRPTNDTAKLRGARPGRPPRYSVAACRSGGWKASLLASKMRGQMQFVAREILWDVLNQYHGCVLFGGIVDGSKLRGIVQARKHANLGAMREFGVSTHRLLTSGKSFP